MSTPQVLLRCVPFFAVAAVGVHFLLVCFVPSWRELGWNHWKYTTSWGRSGEGDFSVTAARRLYLLAGVILLLIAFLGIRHFAGIPGMVPDLFGEG